MKSAKSRLAIVSELSYGLFQKGRALGDNLRGDGYIDIRDTRTLVCGNANLRLKRIVFPGKAIPFFFFV